MSKKQSIPSNLNTLFLRNIETILISKGVICSCELNQFRKEISPHILQLLSIYTNDYESMSINGLINQYVKDSNALRKYVEHLSMNTNEMHY